MHTQQGFLQAIIGSPQSEAGKYRVGKLQACGTHKVSFRIPLPSWVELSGLWSYSPPGSYPRGNLRITSYLNRLVRKLPNLGLALSINGSEGGFFRPVSCQLTATRIIVCVESMP